MAKKPFPFKVCEQCCDGTSGGGAGGGDGFSPIATVTQTENGAEISITDVNGTTTATVTNGADGYSPTVNVTPISGGHIVDITDKNGTKRVSVLNGRTPVKGTDYWTDADIAEIKGYVDEAILGGAW